MGPKVSVVVWDCVVVAGIEDGAVLTTQNNNSLVRGGGAFDGAAGG